MADPDRLDELKRKFDENPKRYFAPLANEYRKAGQPELAIELCRTHLPQQPTHMSGYIVYGQALHDAGHGDESAAVFKQALTLDPENIIALRHLGDISRDAGDNVGAMRWYGVGLPAYSGHNGYRNWGPPPEDASPVVLVYENPPDGFEGCVLKARLRNDSGTDNEEVGAGVWVCDGPVGGWRAAWPRLVHYDA